MPVARLNICTMIREDQLFLARREVEHLGGVVVRARDELERGDREREVANTILGVGFELVLLLHFHVRIHDASSFVARNDVFLIVT